MATKPANEPSGGQQARSLLDTDLYKLTMQCAILKYMPSVPVTYAFTNRTPLMRLSRSAFTWLQTQVSDLANLSITPDELSYLRTTCPYFSSSYLSYLSTFKLQPSSHVKLTFTPLQDTDSADDRGDLDIHVSGLWVDTILYEIPLLALTSEAYFRFCDQDWDHSGQEKLAYTKGMTLLEAGCVFSEFGTRRRRDYKTMDLLMQGLTRASQDAQQKGYTGKLSGTSNVHFAMRYGIPPVGTVAHEWFMGVASITNSYEHASETALRYWVGCFGEGVLSIALTDTFGTPTFLRAFRERMPSVQATEAGEADGTVVEPEGLRPAVSGEDGVVDVHAGENGVVNDGSAGGGKAKSYAETFTGVRQDSGDPLEFVKVMRRFYDDIGVKEKKTIVFSDSLNVEKCIQYKEATEAAGLTPAFGIGTFFSNDFTHVSNGRKSAPLNIVIKLSTASGRPAIKISDNIGKITGDSATVQKVKQTLGYVEKGWEGGDESTRWGREGLEGVA